MRSLLQSRLGLYLDELGEQDGDKVELNIEKMNLNAPTFARGLNIVACYAPKVRLKKIWVHLYLHFNAFFNFVLDDIDTACRRPKWRSEFYGRDFYNYNILLTARSLHNSLLKT